jgi:outer membrane biosynthesis protein TonB
MKESIILFTLCLVFAIIVAPAAANEYTRLSEQNLTDAREDLGNLDIIGALYHFLDSQHWTNMATDIQDMPTATPTTIATTIPTTEPTVKPTIAPTPSPEITQEMIPEQVVQEVSEETPVPTTIETTIPTTEPTPIPTVVTTIPTPEPTPTPIPKDAKAGVKKALEDSENERAVPMPRNES